MGSDRLGERLLTDTDTRRPSLKYAGRQFTYGDLFGRAGGLLDQIRSVVRGSDRPRVMTYDLEPFDLLAVMVCGLLGEIQFISTPHGSNSSSMASLAKVARPDVQIVPRGARTSPQIAECLTIECGGEAPIPLSAPSGGLPSILTVSSGTVGDYKVIEVDGAALSRFAEWSSEMLRIGPKDTWLEVGSLGVDLVMNNIVMALGAGAAVAIPAPADRLQLAALANRVGATASRMAPQLAHMFVNMARRRPEGQRLDVMALGGDRVSPNLIGRILDAGVTDRIVVTYGKAETAGFVLYRDECGEESPYELDNVVLDRAAPGTNAFVDSDGRRARAGTGELVLHSSAIAMRASDAEGSHRLKTASGSTTELKTGDLARLGIDGVAIGGRTDRRANVAGFLVDLADIERAIAEATGEECFVGLVQGDLICATSTQITAHQLSRLIKDRLPLRAHPKRVVRVTLPRTASSKVAIAESQRSLETVWAPST